MTLPAVDSLWDYQDPEETERSFRDVLPAARQSGDTSYLVELLSQTARAVCLQRRFDDAHALLDEAESFLTDSMHRPRLRCLLERGRILNDTHRQDEALQHFHQAWEIAERLNDRLLGADTLHMIAYVATGDESIAWHEKAIDYCENSDGERFRRWLTTLYMNVVDEYEERSEFDAGLRSSERALVISEELGLADRVRDAQCCIARMLRLKGDYTDAMERLEPLRNDPDARGLVFEEYAECLLALGERDKAAPHFRRAYDLLSTDPWYPPTLTERLERLRLLGEGG